MFLWKLFTRSTRLYSEYHINHGANFNLRQKIALEFLMRSSGRLRHEQVASKVADVNFFHCGMQVLSPDECTEVDKILDWERNLGTYHQDTKLRDFPIVKYPENRKSVHKFPRAQENKIFKNLELGQPTPFGHPALTP
jgi:hypothetical protein